MSVACWGCAKKWPLGHGMHTVPASLGLPPTEGWSVSAAKLVPVAVTPCAAYEPPARTCPVCARADCATYEGASV